ncbi:uncharacterized protein LOC117182131 isoform X2 [Belonocnema kinseyi]|uniref:uncharacterized protein LOC117182131 isoform X2 n=1 Tax=Belonocnema kinseyi TaxID=2817044 RepID=UPI00143DE88D|nr:uncharacterized protein LOC117182131 isoform X2 [Belonocnema kinseyi]
MATIPRKILSVRSPRENREPTKPSKTVNISKVIVKTKNLRHMFQFAYKNSDTIKKFAVCLLCKANGDDKEIKMTEGNTSGLSKHLRNYHEAEYEATYLKSKEPDNWEDICKDQTDTGAATMAGFQTSGNALWAIFEAESAFFPEDLKLILKATKYDNLFSLENFTEKDKEKIEVFMQTILYQIIKEEDRELYYGIFKDHPERFVFVGGHEQTLTAMIKLAKRVATSHRWSKDPAFVSTTSRKSLEQSSVKQETDEERILTLKTTLDTNVNKYIQENYSGQPLAQVSARVVADGLGSYIATLGCPFADCKKLTKITRNKTRWNTSNFYAHVNTHCSQKKQPRNTVNLVQMLSQMKEQTSENQNSENNLKGEDPNPKRIKNSDSSSGEEGLESSRIYIGQSLANEDCGWLFAQQATHMQIIKQEADNEEENCRMERNNEAKLVTAVLVNTIKETNLHSSKADWNFPDVERVNE